MKKTITKKSTNKRIQTTSERLRAEMSPQELKKHEEGLRDFLLSELLIAITNANDLSVRKLAQELNVSPTIIQSMRSGEDKDYSLKTFLKVLQGLKCKKFTITMNKGKNINIPLVSQSKR